MDNCVESECVADDPFSGFDRKFASLMEDVDTDATDKGWEPFYHLATGEQVWDLFSHGRMLDLANIPPRRNLIEQLSPDARIKPHLRSHIRTPSGRAQVRQAVYNVLAADRCECSSALLAAHRPVR